MEPGFRARRRKQTFFQSCVFCETKFQQKRGRKISNRVGVKRLNEMVFFIFTHLKSLKKKLKCLDWFKTKSEAGVVIELASMGKT